MISHRSDDNDHPHPHSHHRPRGVFSVGVFLCSSGEFFYGGCGILQDLY